MNMLLPELIKQHTDDAGRLVLTLRIQPELDYFSGHFPGLPLLPGVVQVDWVARLAQAYLPEPTSLGEFVSLDNLKFQSMVFPGAEIDLMLDWQASSGRLSFAYSQDNQAISSGRISFKVADAT